MPNTLTMTDLSGQRRVNAACGEGAELTPQHSVKQVLEYYLEQTQVEQQQREGLQWSAYSRGVRLDHKQRIGELPTEDTEWMIMPNVSAG